MPPAALEPFLREVEHFALTDYAQALGAGRDAVAGRTTGASRQSCTTIRACRWTTSIKANLRVNGGEFEKTLQDDSDTTTGRLDTRFSGPTMDPMSKEADYDPQSAAISSAYVSAFNDYVRNDAQVRREPDLQAGDRRGEELGVSSISRRAPSRRSPARSMSCRTSRSR